MTNSSWIDKWQGFKVFVLRDVTLDKFVYGQAERISPETPIPVLHHQSEKSMLGGAAHVARNIIALVGGALLVGALGDDDRGELVAGPLIARDRIEGRFVRLAGHPTTTKVRFVSGNQQIMRSGERAKVDSVVLTRGARGMTILDPAEARGAAGVAVSKRGTAVVHARELLGVLGGGRGADDPKIVANEDAAAIVADWKSHGLKVAFTNGCFDLLHPGHVELLKRSRAVSDRLVVALNADSSVRRL